jgi:uncharacterized protein (DUF433 family)
MATEAITDISTLLEMDPDYRQGRPCLRGTGITVHNVAIHHNMGASVAAMVESNPDVHPALFYAALAFYFANKDRIDGEIEEDQRYGADLAARYPKGIIRGAIRD